MATKNGPKPMPALKRTYLVAYNAFSAALWSVVLVRTAQTLASDGPEAVYPVVGEWTKWTQTLAGLEIVHSVFGVFFFMSLALLSPLCGRAPAAAAFPAPPLSPFFFFHINISRSSIKLIMACFIFLRPYV